MNKREIIEKLNNAGIYQLRKGESVKDALDYVDGKKSRVGYEYKHRDGSLMDQNQIIMAANKEAFGKTVRKPDYIDYELDEYDVEGVTGEDDFRDDTTKPGELQSCHYCGKPLRVDEGANFDILNCNGCSSYAIWRNCM